MSRDHGEMEEGIVAFGALLEAEFGQPIAHWADRSPWSDFDRLRIFNVLAVLVTQPLTDVVANSLDEVQASETGARTRRILSDAKIAGREWEASWQWNLLAGVENATREVAGAMVTPADPRLFVLRTSYGAGLIPVLAGYLAEILCARTRLGCFEVETTRDSGGFLSRAAAERAAALRQIPGFETASADFLAGLLFMIERSGTKAFCAWCEDQC
jgi:hypothetical protein